ncbi:hypothetical protein ACFY5D_20810 [Paeniglutamicibacter sp. NPDC012692]|uniref:hypothetical protein n=1 Tax=Paeniglutamicibacter sp. NPDC012692 TaxID=3364388 RepID=UPI0036BCB1E4
MSEDSYARLRFANIRQLPGTGLFADEVGAIAPDVQAVSIDLDDGGNIDLTGIENLPLLSWLIVHHCDGILSYGGSGNGVMALTRLLMPYAQGVTEQLVASPHLQDIEIEGGTLDLLKHMPETVREVELRRVKSASDPAAWDRLSQLDRVAIYQSGTIEVAAPADGWPEFVNFIVIGSLKGIVQASEVCPFQHLYFEGVRLFDPGASFWDLQAKCVTVGYSTKPPKWLVEAWPQRPEDWAERFSIASHRLLPGSEEPYFDEL